MMNIRTPCFTAIAPSLWVACFLAAMAGGCGGGTSSGGDGIFNNNCRISDPDFPFCGADIVPCRNEDQTLYQVFDKVCPVGWTLVPDDVDFPPLACTNPEGVTSDPCSTSLLIR